ncbi:MAG: MarC family protein [Candidatus Wallbacteria bacterium]|nr:MarC family protein [Candidatus Wallbacteria bacterium]
MFSNDYIATVFITVITVIDPIGLAPIYLGLAGSIPKKKQNRIIVKSVIVALLITSFFLFLGKAVFHYLDISFEAMYIVGGALLFLIGMDMIYARPRRTKSSPEEEEEAKSYDDISIFPLAIPMLSGPGTISVVVMFSSRMDSLANQLLIFSAAFVAFLFCGLSMYFSQTLLKLLGNTGLNVLNRLLGILLSALAIQFFINAFTSLIRKGI